ncbi:MAG: hypothetical protein RLO81_14130 [Fulvivirga sp.]|uniref:hypothetical protein n=1 Tax=Fulvivirga sp. TaxID=1931237 RepID=UPI0032EAB1B8
MKNNLLKSLLFLALAVFLFACSDDDETAAPDPLEGTWVLKSFARDCEGTANDSETNFTCDDQDCIRVIYLNGTATVVGIYDGVETIDDTYSYTINGNTVNNVDGDIVQWEIVGDDLIITNTSGDCIITVRYYKV